MAQLKGSTALESKLNNLVRKLTGHQPVLKVGFFEEATYPDGTPVAEVATFQEFGTAKIPPRPFFRNMIADNQASWGKGMAMALKKSNYDAKQALEITGQVVAGQLKQSIIDLVTPPLSPATIARKGFDKPLIDTAHMLNSVSYNVF